MKEMLASVNPWRLAVGVAILLGLAFARFACVDTTSENGYKQAIQLTPEQERADAERRIKIIQDDPRIPEQSKRMFINMTRQTVASPPGMPPKVGRK